MTRALEVARAALVETDGDAEALAHVESSGLVRFAASEIHQPTLIDNAVAVLRVVRDSKVGVAKTNRVDDAGLRDLARRAEEAAASAPRNPEFPGLATPERAADVGGFDATTARLGPEGQARLAGEAIDAAETPIYGFFTSGTSELAVASTTGVAAEQRMSDATALVVAAADGISGYADASSWRVGDVDPAAVAREASEKAQRTRAAKTIEPRSYAAVLEPYALADLVQYFAYDSFGALGLLEERGYFTGRLGKRVFDETISIADDALDRRGFPKAFDFEGTPRQRVELVTNGVARGVVWDRATANRAGSGARTTGHAPPQELAAFGPLPFAISVAGGDADSSAELVERVGDGIYVTRLHYLGVVHPREGVITGMTRDGTFRIRDGKIAEPLVNLRFTVAVPELLASVRGLTRHVKLVNASNFYGERYPYGVLAPALATASFNVTGVGSTPG
ncbi:MAG TPA: metallopeptidase TldD-related protein, partial [Gaiellaceae bacterium]|nr:metallopeptidase TldD-related protein [Gaiellaceae bacterium]